MITIKDIINFSKPHPVVEGGRALRIGNDNVEFSIVGGARGLYGDFINDFEVAIFDKENGEFVTKFFYPEASDDVIGYMSGKSVESLINKVLKDKDFQVR
jgi:hypothetical protein